MDVLRCIRPYSIVMYDNSKYIPNEIGSVLARMGRRYEKPRVCSSDTGSPSAHLGDKEIDPYGPAACLTSTALIYLPPSSSSPQAL